MATVLVIDDEPSVLELARRYLTNAGFGVLTASDGGLGRELGPQADAVVLDVMLPGQDGWTLLAHFKNTQPARPVLMLSALGDEHDRLRGLENGADDYLVKPFSPRELVARIKNLLQRTPTAQTLRCGAIELDAHNRMARAGGQPLELTTLEFELLALFVAHPGRLWSRDALLLRLWGDGFAGVDRVVDVHVSGLRRKLGVASQQVRTVRGVGYRLEEA